MNRALRKTTALIAGLGLALGSLAAHAEGRLLFEEEERHATP